jgi:hypothetical protein
MIKQVMVSHIGYFKFKYKLLICELKIDELELLIDHCLLGANHTESGS